MRDLTFHVVDNDTRIAVSKDGQMLTGENLGCIVGQLNTHSEGAADAGLLVSVEGNLLVISIGIERLADAARSHSEWRDDDDEPLLTVTDTRVFAESITGALRREEDDGTTPLDVLFDDAITHAVEEGEMGVDLRVSPASGDDE